MGSFRLSGHQNGLPRAVVIAIVGVIAAAAAVLAFADLRALFSALTRRPTREERAGEQG